MITVDNAKEIAKKQSPGWDTMKELDNAYIFYTKTVDNSEIVILKESGEYMDYITYVERYKIPK